MMNRNHWCISACFPTTDVITARANFRSRPDPVNEALPINPSLEDCTKGFAIPVAVRGVQCQSGFRITIFDERTRGDNWKPRLERVVVAGE